MSSRTRLAWPGTHFAAEPTETSAGETAVAGAAVVAKPVPTIVIWVPLGPVARRDGGDQSARAEAVNVNADASVADWLSGRVTVTPTAPAACAGVVAVIVVASRARRWRPVCLRTRPWFRC